MREGPPMSPASPSAMASGMFSSTTTLLKEISSLRSRLKELEDDTRSSISVDEKENELIMLLRKELSRAETANATLEKDYMNQMAKLALENQTAMSELRAKLTATEKANAELGVKLRDALSESETTRVRELLEQERESHASERDQLKKNLASADLEIGENRREVDHLHMEIDELHSHKVSLLEELTTVRLELAEERKKSQSAQKELTDTKLHVDKLRYEVREKNLMIERKDEEIGSMNDRIIELEGHKEMLVSEVTDLKMQLLKAESEGVSYPSSPQKSASVPDEPIENAITLAEKKKLECDVTRLEERLIRFQSKLTERDMTIEELSNHLNEERRVCTSLRDELNSLKSNASVSSTNTDETRVSAKDPVLEASFLRKRNKVLNDEVKALRKRLSDLGQSPVSSRAQSPERSDPLRSQQEISTPVPQRSRATPPPPLVISPKQPVKLTGIEENNSPRTPVSGLVASFERRINRNTASTRRLEEEPQETSAVDLQRLLDQERETVQQLHIKLRNEKSLVSELRAELEKLSVESPRVEDYESKLRESQEEVERLRKKIEDYETIQQALEMRLRAEENEVDELRMELDKLYEHNHTLERQGSYDQREIERLHAELGQSPSDSSVQEEKKDEENEEELNRLRAQLASLMPELENAMTEIERLNGEIEKMKVALKEAEDALALKAEADSASTKSNKKHDAEVNKLTVELTKTQVSKAELETECSLRIKELEAEMEALEIEAEQELEEKDRELTGLRLALVEKEEIISRLEAERTQLCSSMNDMSSNRKDELEELQGELFEMTTKTATQAREMQVLKMKLEECEAREGEVETKLREKIAALEEQIKDLLREARDQIKKSDVEALRSENTKLRETIRTVKLERRSLQERLDTVLSERSTSKSAQVLRERNAALKEEVEKLTRRLKKMEESITRFAI